MKNERSYGIILSYIEIFFSVVLNFLTTGFFVRHLSQSEFGLFNGVVEMLAFFGVMDFGLTSTLVRYYSRFKVENDVKGMQNIFKICKKIYDVIAIFVLIIGLIIFAFLDYIYKNSFTPQEIISAKKIYLIFLINIVFNFVMQVYHSVLSANERFIFLRSLNIITVILQALISLIAVLFYPSAVILAVVQAFFNVVPFIIKYFYCKNVLKITNKLGTFDNKLFKEIAKFSMLIFLNMIIDQLFWRSNIQIIGMTVNTQAIAIYGSALKIVTKYMLLSTVISGIFLPKVSGLVAKKVSNEVLSDLFIRVGRIQFLVLSFVLMAFSLFGRQFIRIWLTDSYAECYQITLFLMIPFTVDLIQNIAQVILQAQNRLKFRILVFLLISFFNVIVTFPVVKNFGICASSAVTGIIFGIGNLFIMNIYYSKELKLDIKKFWLEILKIMGVSLCLGILGIFIGHIQFFGDGFFNLALKVALFLIVYFIAMYIFAMNNYEKNIVISIFYKVYNFLHLNKFWSV